MTQEQLRQFLDFAQEQRNLEYKTSMSWSEPLTKSKVLKACLAMANIRDGGYLIFGVDEVASGDFKPIGMQQAHFDSFNQDDVQDYINKYADPYVELGVGKFQLDSKLYIAIEIQEFSSLPVVCKKGGENGLVVGHMYTRPRRKLESVIVPSQTDMREILELYLEKEILRMRRLVDIFPKEAPPP